MARKRQLPRGLYKRDDSPNYYMDYTTHSGRRVQKSLRTPHLPTARKLYQREVKKAEERDLGTYQPDLRIRILTEKYLKAARVRHSDRTRQLYRTVLDRFCEHLDPKNERLARTITPADVEDYRSWRASPGGSPTGKAISKRTLAIDMRVIRAFLNWAANVNYLDDNPADPVDKLRPGKRDKTVTFLQPDERDALLEACATPVRAGNGATRPRKTPLATMAALAVFAGLRLGEIRHLRWEHVDLERAELHVLSTKDHRTKDQDDRKLPIVDRLDAFFRNHWSVEEKRGKDYCFTTGHDTLYRSENLLRELKKASGRAGIEAKVNWNILRHTFASNLVVRGISIFEVSKLLGHGSVSTTEKHYADLVPTTLGSKLNRAFDQD